MLLVALEMLLEMPDNRPPGCSALAGAAGFCPEEGAAWAGAAVPGFFSFFLETAFPFFIW